MAWRRIACSLRPPPSTPRPTTKTDQTHPSSLLHPAILPLSATPRARPRAAHDANDKNRRHPAPPPPLRSRAPRHVRVRVWVRASRTRGRAPGIDPLRCAGPSPYPLLQPRHCGRHPCAPSALQSSLSLARPGTVGCSSHHTAQPEPAQPGHTRDRLIPDS